MYHKIKFIQTFKLLINRGSFNFDLVELWCGFRSRWTKRNIQIKTIQMNSSKTFYS